MEYDELEKYFHELDRSLFIDKEMKIFASLDQAIPVGYGQTISQPSLVLKMTKLLEPEKDSRVLEIGTGTGYQTALLAKMSGEVYTIERIPELAEKAKDRLTSLGFTNIFFRIADGSNGWIEKAPFDRIIVTAAAGKIPLELIDQLAVKGKMIIPIGPRDLQELQLITKKNDQSIVIETVEYVIFVEMKGKYGWD